MVNKGNLAFAITGLVAVVVISGCTQVEQSAMTGSKSLVIANQTILNEVARLSTLAVQKKIAVEDLGNLEGMVKGDEAAEHEFHEIETLTKYGEYVHASHALAFLGDYISTGKETLCPAHLLAHYYLFTRHNETELAGESLEEAKGQLEEWIPKAKEFNEKYPSGQNVDDLATLIDSHLKSIEGGDSVATDEEINFLANNGLCVQD